MGSSAHYWPGPVGVTEVDFGTTPVASGTFTVTDAKCTSSAMVMAQQDYGAPTGKDADENEMDQLIIRAGSGTDGSFSLFIESSNGSYLHDVFRIKYSLNNQFR